MVIDANDEATLSARTAQLELARTDVALGPLATITPRTFARLDATLAADSAAPEPIDLPRISVDERAEPLGRAEPAAALRDYAIVGTLGEGGMGRVHLARQRSLQRDVALKTLKPGAPWAVALALLHEAKLTGSLEHPGVIPVHLLGVDENGRPMLVMKRVDGVDFGTLLADRAHAAWRGRSDDRLAASLEILSHVCQTLEFAHSRGVLHRDIKPENVMVGHFGEVYLLDWGIATAKDDASDPNALVGTPAYMAPEMVRGAAVDERTDVYLLGATLHEILTGRPRHDGATVMQVLAAAIASAPFEYGADVPERLARLANGSTSRDPAHRPATARMFREEIGDFLRHRSARAVSDAAMERLAELDAALDAAGAAAVPRDLAGAYRLATEARFGLVQSLRAHPGDNETNAGMRRCLAAAIELELRQGHADSAEALLREMDSPDAELAARIEVIRERAAATERDKARLETLERDLDPSEQGRWRVLPMVMLGLLAIALGSLVEARGEGAPSPIGAVALAAFTSTIVVGGAYVLRGRLSNAFNRRAAATTVIGILAILANRTLALVTATPVPTTLALDLLLLTTVATLAGVTLYPRLAWAGLATGAGAIGAALRPDHAAHIFVAATFVMLVAAAWSLPRRRR